MKQRRIDRKLKLVKKSKQWNHKKGGISKVDGATSTRQRNLHGAQNIGNLHVAQNWFHQEVKERKTQERPKGKTKKRVSIRKESLYYGMAGYTKYLQFKEFAGA